MSKRVTLTEIEIKYILDLVNFHSSVVEMDKRYAVFTLEGLANLKYKLTSKPKEKPKGLLKVHHD